VFTTDMIFALLLMVTCLAISGQAYDMATGHAKNYTQRYELEREAHDAADVLIKTPGIPADWKWGGENIESLGLAGTGADNNPKANKLDLHKLHRLSQLIKTENIDNSIKRIFGGTKNFDIKIKENETTHIHHWPGWDNENKSGAEDSLEIASASRIVYGSLVGVRDKTKPFTLVGEPPEDNKVIEFWVGENEPEMYEWYLFCENKGEKSPPTVFYSVNVDGTPGPKIVEGGKYPDNVRIDNRLIEDNLNYVQVSTQKGNKWDDIKIWVAIRPTNSNIKITPDTLDPGPMRLQVRIWRD